MAIEFSARVARIPVYPAASAYALPEDVALLASNESPDPPLPQVVEAITRVLGGLNRYPDPTNARLRGALSDRYGVPSARIAIGNGSCDVLLALGEALLEPGAELVYAWPSFSVYPHLAAASGRARRPRTARRDRPSRPRGDARRDHRRDAARDRLQPEQPDEHRARRRPIADFVARVPRHVCVLVDEAYCEFNTLDDPDATLPLLDEHPNLILLRTFSKIYGLAGLRVGFALCGSAETVTAVNQVRQPFFCSAAAQAAATEALRHQDAVAERVERAIVARVEIADGLESLGLTAAESQANFCWFGLPGHDGDDAPQIEKRIVDGLAQRGVLVRAGSALGRDGWLRVTYGTPAQNERFLRELEAVLGG